MAFQAANLQLPNYTPGLSQAVGGFTNTSTGTAIPSAPPTNQLYNAGTNTSIGGRVTPVTSGAALAKATGTSGNVPIQGPPPAPNSPGPGTWTGPPVAGAGVTTPPLKDNSGNDTPFGQLVKIGPGRNPIQERDYQRMLAEWNASHPQPTPTPPPVSAPPPTATPQAAKAPRPIGSTALPLSTDTGGGTAGAAFPALTQAAQATKGLQLPGLAKSVISAITGGAGQIGQDVAQGLGTFAQGVGNLFGGPGINSPLTSQTSKVPPQSKEQLDSQSRSDAIQKAMQEKAAAGRPAPGFITKLEEGIQNVLGVPYAQQIHPVEHAGQTIQQAGSSSEATYTPQLRGTPQALTTPAGVPTNVASPANLQGPVVGPQAQQAMSAVASGHAKAADVAPSITNSQAPAMIVQAINQAQQAGDMQAVGRLTELHTAVTNQLNFINQITQMITAMSAGFGTPNAPGITEARTPMVQQGIGQALTTPAAPPSVPGGLPGQNAQIWSPNLLTAPTQMNKPVINPFMGNTA